MSLHEPRFCGLLWYQKRNPLIATSILKTHFTKVVHSISIVSFALNCLEASCPHKLDISFIEGLSVIMCYVSEDVRSSQTATLQDVCNAYHYPKARVPCLQCMFVDSTTRRLRASSCQGTRRYEERKIDGKVPPFFFIPVEHFNEDLDRFDNILTFLAICTDLLVSLFLNNVLNISRYFLVLNFSRKMMKIL